MKGDDQFIRQLGAIQIWSERQRQNFSPLALDAFLRILHKPMLALDIVMKSTVKENSPWVRELARRVQASLFPRTQSAASARNAHYLHGALIGHLHALLLELEQRMPNSAVRASCRSVFDWEVSLQGEVALWRWRPLPEFRNLYDGYSDGLRMGTLTEEGQLTGETLRLPIYFALWERRPLVETYRTNRQSRAKLLMKLKELEPAWMKGVDGERFNKVCTDLKLRMASKGRPRMKAL